jgi:endonuclease/exonuclease/phosphatase family metal-dependent hydrolase
MPMTLLSGNVAGRVQRQPEPVERIVALEPDLAKVRSHEALHAHLAAGHRPRALCGDLNTPRWRQEAGLSDHSPLVATLDW